MRFLPLSPIAPRALARPLLACALACALATAPARAAEPGTIVGQVFDRDSGEPVADVTVVVLWPPPADGSPAPQEVRSTDAEGAYRVEGVPAGVYSISFVKSGYRASKMTGFEVQAGTVSRADFPIQPTPPETAEAVLELEAFVVEAEVVDDIMDELELRMDSDQLLNIMSAEDFSKFAASDVADALKRVSGVSVVEGQFAIIRGLEDRYSSNLYNSAPIPSPDPDSQSPQLDLFPSEVVSNLIVSKTFGPDQPGNSSGGSINIITHDYPETFDLKLKYGSGWEDGARDRFFEFVEGSPVGRESDDVREDEFGGLIGGRYQIFDREIRLKGVYNFERDYRTAQGFQEERAPRLAQCLGAPRDAPGCSEGDPFDIVRPGDAAFGLLSLSGGRFDLTESSYSEQETRYAGFGFDLDSDALHQIDGSWFFTDKTDETVEVRENGYFPAFDYDRAIESVLDAGGDFNPDPLFFGQGATFPPRISTGGRPGEGGVGAGAWIANGSRAQLNAGPENGALFYSNFQEHRSFKRERDLEVFQGNGKHDLSNLFGGLFEGLKLSWAGNHATTSQREQSLGVRMFYERPEAAGGPSIPADLPALGTQFPLTVQDIGPDGRFFTWRGSGFFVNSTNDIEETQDFGRLDAEYEREVFDWLSFELKAGGWYERAERSVESKFLIGESVTTPTSSSSFAFPEEGARTALELGQGIFPALTLDADGDTDPTRDTFSDATREIWAWSLGGKLTLFDRIDLLGGVRHEDIFIEALNDPIIDGDLRFGAPNTFPDVYLLFDSFDNPFRTGEEFAVPAGLPTNADLLGIDVPVGECLQVAADGTTGPSPDPSRQCTDLLSLEDINSLVNGRIEEVKWLPSAGFSIRPWDGITLRGAWSRTVARPSFRELGFYISVEPGTDDETVGNPQLRLSEVESFDLRAEFTWGSLGDLIAVSAFMKDIESPIERIVIRNQSSFEDISGSFVRTFFNNPNPADLRGIEFEFRKNFGFLNPEWIGYPIPALAFLQYLSVGGNYTYIDAEVGRTEAVVARAREFFLTCSEDEVQAPFCFDTIDPDTFAFVPAARGPGKFSGLDSKRRLFNQPEWIINLDVSFDHPDWGTKWAVSFFAISDILDAAGGASLIVPNTGEVEGFLLDRYVDSFYQLDATFSQRIPIPTGWGSWELPGPGDHALTFNASVKNLTDSRRRIIYDPEQTSEDIPEREYRIGRDYSFSLTYSFSF